MRDGRVVRPSVGRNPSFVQKVATSIKSGLLRGWSLLATVKPAACSAPPYDHFAFLDFLGCLTS